MSNRIKISRPLEKDLYIGNKLNKNQSILIDGVFYNIDKLIQEDPLRLWQYLYPDIKSFDNKPKFYLDSKVYSQLKLIIQESYPELIQNLEDKKNSKQTKKELEDQINNSQIDLPGARFTSLGKRHK